MIEIGFFDKKDNKKTASTKKPTFTPTNVRKTLDTDLSESERMAFIRAVAISESDLPVLLPALHQWRDKLERELVLLAVVAISKEHSDVERAAAVKQYDNSFERLKTTTVLAKTVGLELQAEKQEHASTPGH